MYKKDGSSSITGLLLMTYIYVIDWQVTGDVAVWQNIAKGTSWVQIWVRSLCSSAHWAFAMSSIPKAGLRSVLITGAILDHFCLFTGANSSNPVNYCMFKDV